MHNFKVTETFKPIHITYEENIINEAMLKE